MMHKLNYLGIWVMIIAMVACQGGGKQSDMAMPDSLRSVDESTSGSGSDQQSVDSSSRKEEQSDSGEDPKGSSEKSQEAESRMSEEKEIIEKIDSMQKSQPKEVSGEAMSSIVKNIASPVEMAALIKSMDLEFTNEYLADPERTDDIISSQSKAFNLGLYGADLGYINMYQEKSMVLDYVRAVKGLADELNVGQFFNFGMLKRLAQNRQNLDSLMYISVRSFNRIDKYLRKNDRGSISAIIICGSWLEGMYLISRIAEEKSTEDLKQSIGEQKTILNQMMLILKNYQQSDYVSRLVKEVSKIKQEFDNVRITIEKGEPESVVEDGQLKIVQNEKSVVHMSDNCLEKIIKTTQEVRNTVMQIK